MAWAHSMELMLDAKELWRLVDGTKLKPDVATRPQDSKAWSFDDKQARMWLDSNCEDQQHAHVNCRETYKEAWNTLRQVRDIQSGMAVLLNDKVLPYRAGATDTDEDAKSELCKIREMIRNVRATELPTEFDIALVLMNAIDNEAYDLVKYHQEEMKELALS